VSKENLHFDYHSEQVDFLFLHRGIF